MMASYRVSTFGLRPLGLPPGPPVPAPVPVRWPPPVSIVRPGVVRVPPANGAPSSVLLAPATLVDIAPPTLGLERPPTLLGEPEPMLHMGGDCLPGPRRHGHGYRSARGS